MGKKKKKDKKKKVSAKKEKYAKFRKDKPATLDVSMPDLTDEQRKQKMADEEKINRHLRFSKNLPAREIRERRMVSKRDKVKK